MSWGVQGSNRKQIYVSGLPKDINEKELVEKFGQVGPIAKDPKRSRYDPSAKKVWLYTDKRTGRKKGDGTITYADDEAAQAAVQFFHNQEMPGWDGQKLHVSIAERKEGWDRGKHWAGGGGGGGYSSNAYRRVGDTSVEVDERKVNEMLGERTGCKMSRNFDRADEIRSELEGMGVRVDDREKTWTTGGSGGGGGAGGAGGRGGGNANMVREGFAISAACAVSFFLLAASVSSLPPRAFWHFVLAG